MAEKGERILIKKQINYHPPYGGWCGDGKEIVLTRQEAIEHMAKAICKFEMMNARHICKDCSKECFEHLELEVVYKSEAALNALLEGK